MGFWEVFKVLIVLIILLGSLYGIAFLLKKYLLVGKASVTKGKVQILSTQMLMPKKYLSIIKVNGNVYLLGSTDQNITVIDKFENTEDFEVPVSQESEKLSHFMNLIKKK